MNRAEMNNFIANYLQNDKTTYAMMLSGEWGTGKSFYIKGELKECREIKDNGNELIVISLYGMTNLQELSQRICYERFHTSINAVKAIKATAKTIINYSPLPQIFWNGVEKAADKIKEKIDESIDLTGILLVLEDIERTKIDLEDFFGYVNNLCEQDGVKVLLVADENIIKEKLDNYDKIKDKVVGDTIHFEPDLEATLRNIFDIYGFNDVCDLKADMDDIKKILPKRPNFRKVIYTCQKVHEIFNNPYFEEYKDDDKYKDFRKCIFLSTLSYIHGGKDSRYLWNKGKIYEYEKEFKNQKEVERNYNLSIKLGNESYPLLYFVYEYLRKQKLDKKSINDSKNELECFRKLLSEVNNIPEYSIIVSCTKHSEETVNDALKKASEYISNKNNNIKFEHLALLLQCLAFIKCDIGIYNDDYKKCEEAILSYFASETNYFPDETKTFGFRYFPSSESSTEYYDELVEKIKESFKCNLNHKRYEESTRDISSFFNDSSISPNSIVSFITNNYYNDEFKVPYSILNAEPKTIENICYAFKSLTTANYSFTEHEKICFVKLKEELEKSFDSIQDKIVKYNIGELLKSLERIIEWTKADTYI